jgi:hypothetical protein
MRRVALIGGFAALAGVVLAGCSSSSGPYPPPRAVAAQVQASGGAAMPGLEVTVWIVDVDLPGDVRQPQQLETRTTDGAGRATWEVQAGGQPYVCGFRVEDSSGQELGYAAPNLNNRLSTDDGLALITL